MVAEKAYGCHVRQTFHEGMRGVSLIQHGMQHTEPHGAWTAAQR